LSKFFKNNTPYLIAEISANHNGSFLNAKKLISMAKKYKANAVKLQTYMPETMTIKTNKYEFLIKDGLWKGKFLWDLYDKYQTPFVWHKKLFNYAKKLNITCFSTPFDETAVKLLEVLKCPFYKISSFEMTDIPLIKLVAKTKKPIIISTGMANLNEIDLTYKIAKKYGAKEIALLYCVSNYPSKITDYNFNNIKILKERYNCTVGFSDHSTDEKVVAAAIAAGAEIIEKHIALHNQKSGPDIAFSIKGKELLKYRKIIDETKIMMGKNFFYRNPTENKSLKFRRSIYAVDNIKAGDKFNSLNVKVIRPGYGLEPKYYESLIGNTSKKNIKKFSKISKNFFKKNKIKIKNELL
jgi:pseudaminic acid synthase